MMVKEGDLWRNRSMFLAPATGEWAWKPDDAELMIGFMTPLTEFETICREKLDALYPRVQTDLSHPMDEDAYVTRARINSHGMID